MWLISLTPQLECGKMTSSLPFCEGDSVEDVMKIDLPEFPLEDTLMWIGNRSGRFTVKSCDRVELG